MPMLMVCIDGCMCMCMDLEPGGVRVAGSLFWDLEGESWNSFYVVICIYFPLWI